MGWKAERRALWKDVLADRDITPFVRYDTAGDELVCEKCGPLDGTVKRWDDPFWKDHFPPWHANCRCCAYGVSNP